jgi:alpha-beta hydrolase superfamily lysophospholipase
MTWDFRMQGDLVRFKTDDNLLLHGFLATSDPKKILIHFHGMGNNFCDFLLPEVIGNVAKCGYSVLSVNSRGHDTISDTMTTRLKWVRGGTAFEKFKDSIHDVKATIDFASKNGFSEIVLSGHSTGCQKITYYQSRAQDKRVKGIVLLAPADDYNFALKRELKENLIKVVKIAKKSKKNDLVPPELLKGSIFGSKRFLSVAESTQTEAQIFNYDSDMRFFSKIKCPILAVFGSKDKYLTKPVEEHFKILRNKTGSPKFNSITMKGADHNFSRKEKELAGKIAGWLVTL